MLSIATVSSSATSVSITATSRQAKLGIYMYSYFENANAPSSSSPVRVDTATSIPGSTGSYTIVQGASAYLWTPQFSSATSIPSGKMTLDLWGGSTPALDGSASSRFNAASGSVSLNTTYANDVVYVVVAIKSTTRTPTISGGGLTWNSRGSAVESGTGAVGGVYAFWAASSTALNAATITANLGSGANVVFVLTAFGISGADTLNPIDSSMSRIGNGTGNNALATVTLNPSGINDFIIGAAFVNNNPTISTGSGFTSIANTASGSSMHGVTEYKNWVASGSQTASFSFSTSQHWAMIADAIVPASSTTISVSAYTTNSAGTIQTTLFSGQSTYALPVSGGQVATVFTVTAGSIPASGFVQVKITAPANGPIQVKWGNGQPTNFQIAFTYS